MVSSAVEQTASWVRASTMSWERPVTKKYQGEARHSPLSNLFDGGANDYVFGGLRSNNLGNKREDPPYNALGVFLIVSVPWVSPEFRARFGRPVED